MKNRIILAVIFFIFIVPIYSQKICSLDDLKKGKSYENALGMMHLYPKDSLYIVGDYDGYITKFHSLDNPNTALNLYRMAACYDKLQISDSTLFYLNWFMDISKDDREILHMDDFPNLQSDSEKWKQVTNKIESLYLNEIPWATNKELALQIFYLAIDRYRIGYKYSKLTAADFTDSLIIADNLLKDPMYVKKVCSILDKYGFPTVQMVGNYAVYQTFDILHHSNSLGKYYPIVKKAFDNHELDSFLFALMTDRVLMQKNKKQIYGSQLVGLDSGKPSGIMKKYMQKYPNKTLLYLVEDFANINQRRKEMGFDNTIEEYVASFKNKNYIIPQEYYEQSKKRRK